MCIKSKLLTKFSTWGLINDINKKLISEHDTVLVYTMGKVGTQSISNSYECVVYKHTFYNNPPCRSAFKANHYTLLSPVDIAIKRFVFRLLVKIRAEVKIICLVRDPMNRNISEFFHHLPYWMLDAQKLKIIHPLDEGPDLLFNVFEKAFRHEYALEWFDKEFKRFTGIDVYQYPFDKDRGYIFIKKKKFDILLMDAKSINTSREIIEKFIGNRQKYSGKTNEASNKWYSTLYREFKNEYRPSEQLVQMVQNSRYYKHFYGR